MSYLKQLHDRLVARGETPVMVGLRFQDGLWGVSVQYEIGKAPVRYPRAATEHEAYEQALIVILDRPMPV